MSESAEDRVYSFVVRETSVRRDKLSPKTTLAKDIGLDGDDAVEFFEAFEKEFGVKLKSLRHNWSWYFVPEGAGFIGPVVVAIPTLIFGEFLHWQIPVLPGWICFALGFILSLAGITFWARTHPDKSLLGITIQELIDTVKLGRWPRESGPLS